jgi:hypothetical protein
LALANLPADVADLMLMAVFLLQTPPVPLALAWALLRGAGTLLQARPRASP